MTPRVRLAIAALLCAVASAAAAAAADTADTATARVDRALGGATPRISAASALLDSMRRPEMPLSRQPASMPGRPSAADTSRSLATIPWMWRTHAERTDYRETGEFDETQAYCRQLEAGSSWVKLTTFGTSPQGRPLLLLVVSRERAFTPEAAHATGKPIVLIQNGIHAGEIEGKDATLALLRDMAVIKTRANLLDSCIVLVMPVFNVDGDARRGPNNRINQNGPASMGWRANAQGLNLNRDYMKADSPEMRAFLALYTTWWPDLLIDDHTTDGADYRHDVTYSFAHGPSVPTALVRWCTDAFEGRVLRRLEKDGHLPAPYLSFRRGGDPRTGIDFGDNPPRFSTNYAALQGRAALLVETHMLKPYGARVQATYDLIAAVLDELRARPRALTGAVRQAQAAIVARAQATGAAREVALTVRTSERAVPFAFKGKVATWATSPVTGAPVPTWTSAPWDTLLPLYREVVPVVSVREPAGYLVPREWPRVAELLRLHGVRVRTLGAGWGDSVEVARVLEWKASPEPYEGHHPLEVRAVKFERQYRTWRPGDFWVPLDQPGALVAVHLCEAQAPDGMLAWNAFDSILQRKEFAEDYVIDPIARQMLAKDPTLAREFQAKLAADSTFAKDPWARGDFFYRRTPWADPEQNLLPIARALHAVPEDALAPVERSAATTR